MRIFFLIVALCAGIGIVGCGDDDSSADSAQSLSTASPAEALKRAPPRVTAPTGPAPKKLVERDLIEGIGAVAQDEKDVVLRYLGIDYETGKTLSTSYGREGEPADFEVGDGSVLIGIEETLPTMKAGGRRELIIPPKLAFGIDGSPPKIPPNTTVVFVIDLVKVE